MDYAISFIVGMLMMLILIAATGALKNDGLVTKAIQQCEEKLPRHQHCEAVISARVVDPIEDGEQRQGREESE